ncbi:MAG: hypothetical protein ACKVT1_20385 [Dehalococcoidia bacterium]
MRLFRIAIDISASLPESDDYADERNFCWLAVGRTAITLADKAALVTATENLRDRRDQLKLRREAIPRFPALAPQLVRQFWDELGELEDHLYRGEISHLAPMFAAVFGPVTAAEGASNLTDAFTKTCFLAGVATATTDRILSRSFMEDAWAAARTVSDDHDYALKHVAGGLMDIGDLEAAQEAIDEMEDPSIRMDYLQALKQAFEARAQHEQAGGVAAAQEALQVANPGVQPQSEVLRLAEVLADSDLPGVPRSDGKVWADITRAFELGDIDHAITLIKQRFPVRFCPGALLLDDDRFDELFSFQVEAVLAAKRNDLKVEFLTDAVTAICTSPTPLRDPSLPPSTVAALTAREAAAPPSIFARDPSLLTPGDVAPFLFNRAIVPDGDETARWLMREPEDPMYVSDPERFVELIGGLFRGFGEAGRSHTPEQVDQGLWFLFGYPFFLWDIVSTTSECPEKTSIDCIRSAFHIFADYVATIEVPEGASAFHMMWDTSWRDASPELLDAILETELRILEIDDDNCRYAALHGLNHLRQHSGKRRNSSVHRQPP